MTAPSAAAVPTSIDEPLGLIAGSGALPRMIAEDRARRGAPSFVVRFEGVSAPWADAFPHADLPFEKPGTLFETLRSAGAATLCFAGAMRRPFLNPLKFDRTAWRLIFRVPPLLLKRDDAMLRGFAALLEAEGFRIVAAHQQLEALLTPEGVLTRSTPDETSRLNAALAAKAVRDLGSRDLGQAAVATRGRIVAREGRDGTDAMLARVIASGEGRGGVLHKAPKPGQDWRLDLPAIGPETMRRAAEAGLAGVSVQARGVLALGLDDVVREADAAGLFLWGRPRDAAEQRS